MDDPMNEREWEVEWAVDYNGQRMITWSEKLCDGRRWIRRTVYFSWPNARVVSWCRSCTSPTAQLMTVDELLCEPYITDELRSYIAQLQN